MSLFASVDTGEFLRTAFPEPDPNAWTPLPHQVPPAGVPGVDWNLWLLIGGRGTGKSDASAHYVNEHVMGPPCDPRVPGGHRISIIAPTQGDAVDSCVTGPSGLKAHNPDIQMRTKPGGTYVYWPNGTEGKLFGAFTPEDVERLRAGGNRCLTWVEELAAWRQLVKAWPHMRFGLRIGPHPHIIGSSTPKPRKFFVKLVNDKSTATTHGTTDDNPYLAESVRQALYDEYGGTSLGAQELQGKIIQEIKGAVASLDRLDEVRLHEHPKLSRRLVMVDPAQTFSEDSDECGITVQGRTGDHVYLLADVSLQAPVEKWALEAIKAGVAWECGSIGYEAPGGSDTYKTVLKAALKEYNEENNTRHTFTIFPVPARLSKMDRAQALRQAIEQGRWHPVGAFDKLEEQLTTWTPEAEADDESKDKKNKKDKSPDRMDAAVHGYRVLMGIGGKGHTTGAQIAAARVG